MPSKGFTSPQILFLNTWDEPERNYCYAVYKRLRERGYKWFVEVCCGSFVMPSVAHEAGWRPEEIECSDVSLFSAILGYAFMERDLHELDIRVDGEPLQMTGDCYRQAGEALYCQLLLRMEARPAVPYWLAIVEDLIQRKEQHINDIESHVRKIDSRMHGIKYEAKDIWRHVEEVADDPRTVISANPPTYTGGFERFFNTKGRLTWAEPAYEVWDAKDGVLKLCEYMKDRAALLFANNQRETGQPMGPPVYARHLAPGQTIYVSSNRTDEVKEAAGGLKVVPLKGFDMTRLNVPTIPEMYEIPADAAVECMVVGGKEATYYRDLWMHKLDFKGAGMYVAFTINGLLAGLAGYDPGPILRPYNLESKWLGHLLLTFAVGAPHKDRLTRLITMLALTQKSLNIALKAQLQAAVKGVITVELTRHPEAKGLRGVMKLETRTADPKYGNRLIYSSPVVSKTWTEVVADWKKKETVWQAGVADRARRLSDSAVGGAILDLPPVVVVPEI